MKYEHDDADGFVDWFMAGTTKHLEELRESLRGQNVPAEDWPHVSERLTEELSTALDTMRQQIRDGTARTRPTDYVKVDDAAYRLAQQKQQILENEIGARRQQVSGGSRRK
jgi:hypothetical protein